MQRALRMPGWWVAVLFLATTMASAAQGAASDTLQSLDGVWAFHAGDNPSFAQSGLDDRDWRKVRVPTQFNRWAERWSGLGWYRLHFRVPASQLESVQLLSLGSARDAIEVYVNGSLVARRGRFGSSPRGGPRIMPLLAWVSAPTLRAGDNVLAVRALDVSWDGALYTGPVLLGSADQVLAATGRLGVVAMAVRIALALLCLWVALAQLAVHLGRGPQRDTWWLTAAGVGLSIVLLDGTGILAASVPSLELSARLPLVGSYVAVLAFGSFFAARYDDWSSRTVRIAQVTLAVLAGLVLPAPDMVVFFVAQPLLVLVALGCTLYAANLLARAARRQEEGAIPVFVSLIALAGIVVYDGLVTTGSDVLPALTLMGATFVLVVTTLVAGRQTAHEHERVLTTMMRLRKQLESQASVGILNASVMSITDVDRFFDVVVDEASRELEVRRCSLVLLDEHGSLRIRASVGLPRHATTSRIELNDASISGWVFLHGRTLTPNNMPPALVAARRRGSYVTDAFVSQPVRVGAQTAGVLNVSDRNDGGSFAPSDEMAVAEVADRLALVLDATQRRGDLHPAPRLEVASDSDAGGIPQLRVPDAGDTSDG